VFFLNPQLYRLFTEGWFLKWGMFYKPFLRKTEFNENRTYDSFGLCKEANKPTHQNEVICGLLLCIEI
jgi:hypothetical protein